MNKSSNNNNNTNLAIPTVKVIVIGAKGKMGQLVMNILNEGNKGKTIEQRLYKVVATVNKEDNLENILTTKEADIAIDLAGASGVWLRAKQITQHRVRPLIGSSGLSDAEIAMLVDECRQKQLAGAIIPNFSLGMAVCNIVAKQYSKYFTRKAIVEYHHAAKQDKPSGTAKYTASLLNIKQSEIASIRSDNFLAKQQLYLGGAGERLVIDHESFSRESFAFGVCHTLHSIMQSQNFTVGLENLLLVS